MALGYLNFGVFA